MEAVQSVYSERVEADLFPSATADKLSKAELKSKVTEIENDLRYWAKIAMPKEKDFDKIKAMAPKHDDHYKHLVRMHNTYSAKLKELGENLDELFGNGQKAADLKIDANILYNDFDGDVNDPKEIKAYLNGAVTAYAKAHGLPAGRLRDLVGKAIQRGGLHGGLNIG